MKKPRPWIQSALALVVIYFLASAFLDTDPTDASRWRRSGMGFYVDYETGCEYLSTGGLLGASGITPRLDANGQHMGCKR